MAASAATMSANWAYPTAGNANGSALPSTQQSLLSPPSMSISTSSKLRSPPNHPNKALTGTYSMSPPGTAASAASSNGGPGSASSATSPSLGDLGNTLHSTFSSLSLNSGSTAASSVNAHNYSNAKSPSDYTRPLPMRTPSSGSLPYYQNQQPAVQISAIGSGRSGTSPPSRSGGNLDSLNENSSIVGSPSSNNALSPNPGVSQKLPPPQHFQQQQRHTPSHSLPWPSYASTNANGGPDPLAFLSEGSDPQYSSRSNGAYDSRNGMDINNGGQQSHFNSHFQQQQHQRQPTSSDISSRSRRLHQTNQYDQQPHTNQDENRPDGQNGGEASSLSSSSRFAQSQFNLDHAQLAKSREQKDLDDIDSGQRASATLWMGDLEGWMDEMYIKRCITALGWDKEVTDTSSSTSGTSSQANGPNSVQTSVKMIKGASSTSGYCFITFPTSAHAQAVLAHFSKQPPMLMPGSERTFKLNWATGLPGVQPKWEGEYSIFVGDLGREVTEGELVALFTPLFQSTKSAKIMYDPTTGLSRGYGFVRFGDENDMSRSLALGQNNTGSGLSLRGRTLRISEASGSGGGARNRTQSNEVESAGLNPSRNARELHIKVPLNGAAPTNLLAPQASGFSIPVASPTSPSVASTPYSANHHGSNGSSGHVTPLSPASDPTNTTVFVGGLPACINEETLRSFFQHFGEITYVKIPPNKGCGFVQFLRRPDAELAIAKMHDFPIHGKSRIRLSWGRSQGDKQVEHVRKLANALNAPFEAVWRMVQGQDSSTIKQIASAVGGNNHIRGGAGGARSGPSHMGPADPETARAGLAKLASLRSSMGPSTGSPSPHGTFSDSIPRSAIFEGTQAGLLGVSPASANQGQQHQQPISGQYGLHDSEAYAFRPAAPAMLSAAEFGFAGPAPPQRSNDAGPYSRVSPSTFAPLSTSNLAGQPQQSMSLSPNTPTPAGGEYTHQQEQPSKYQHPMAGYGGNFDPYHPVSISPPVGYGNAPGPGIFGASFDASSTFGPRSWRQQQGVDVSAPIPSFQGGRPEFAAPS